MAYKNNTKKKFNKCHLYRTRNVEMTLWPVGVINAVRVGVVAGCRQWVVNLLDYLKYP